MSLPKRIQGLVKLSPLALVVLNGLLLARPATRADAVDAAFSAQAQTQTPPTSSPANFDGLDNEDNAAITGFIVRPPDPQLAAGPHDIFEMINIIGGIYSRNGGTVHSFNPASFLCG